MRSVNTGLAMKKYDSSDAAWTAGIALADGGTDWIHVIPSGYYRALDFDGYNELAGAPFQYGPMPNPAYKMDSVQITDASGASTSEIEMTDLMGGDAPVPGMSGYKYYDIRNYNIYTMFGKRNGSTPASAPSLIYALNSTILSQSISDGTWDCVTIFTNKTFANGGYRADNGDFVLAPVGRRSFVKHSDYGFKDAGATQKQVFKVSVFHTLNYPNLGVRFLVNNVWDTSTRVLESSSGTIEANAVYMSTKVLIPEGCTEFRMYVDGNADTRTFPVQYSPT